MTLSVLLYALMLSTLVVLVGVLVVDAVRGRARRRRALPDHGPGMGRARRRRRSQRSLAQP
jgi:hypothetical protein